MSEFAPTPLKGAAYAVAIQTVGGLAEIGACDTQERYRELRAKLDELIAFAWGYDETVRAAYRWGVDKVDQDIQARLRIHENSRAVRAALATLPKLRGNWNWVQLVLPLETVVKNLQSSPELSS